MKWGRERIKGNEERNDLRSAAKNTTILITTQNRRGEDPRVNTEQERAIPAVPPILI